MNWTKLGEAIIGGFLVATSVFAVVCLGVLMHALVGQGSLVMLAIWIIASIVCYKKGW